MVANRAEVIIDQAKRNIREAGAAKRFTEDRERVLVRNQAEEARGLEEEKRREWDKKARIGWSNTGVPELLEQVASQLVGAKVVSGYYQSEETFWGYKSILGFPYGRADQRRIKSREVYTITLITGGGYGVGTVGYDGNPDTAWVTDYFSLEFVVINGQQLNMNLIFSQIGSLKKIVQDLTAHLSNPEFNIKFN